jgi:isocitrate lyase
LTEDQVTQQLHKLFKAFMTSDPSQMNDSQMRNDFRAFARDNYAHAKHIVAMFVK